MFTEKQFQLNNTTFISQKNIDEHLKLYGAYVKNANLIMQKLAEYRKDVETYAYEIAELGRRFSFEYNGMKNHEYFFEQLENGQGEIGEINRESALFAKIERDFGSFENFLTIFKQTAMTRGIGWSMLYYDKQNDILINSWVDEQHLGQLVDAKPILVLDMWEHAFVYDFATSEKKAYVEAFIANINWSVVENRF